MEKVKYRYDSEECKEELVTLFSANENLIKLRVLGYIKKDTLFLLHYIDAKIGESEIIGEIELNQLSEMDFLKKDRVILMDVIIDCNRVPKVFLPLKIRYLRNPDLQLKGDRLKDLAESMHKAILESYPFKEYDPAHHC